jgi:excisionase family DNA binding protein
VKDWALLGLIRDEGHSAKNLKRPGLQRLLALVEARHVEAVIVHKLDRLAHSVADLDKLMKLFECKGVALVSLQESRDRPADDEPSRQREPVGAGGHRRALARKHGAADPPEDLPQGRKEGRVMTDQRLLTPEQVADRLQISRVTVMDYLRKGRLKGHRVGKLWRVKEEDLEAFLEGEPTEEDLGDAKALDEALADPRRYDYEQTRRELGL